jgi:hypothetical protein
MIIIKLIIILINEEKFGEALELAIHNLERIKDRLKELNGDIKDISITKNLQKENINNLNSINNNINYNNNINNNISIQNKSILINQKRKNIKDLNDDLDLNNKFLVRSYFLLAFCYDKIGDEACTFDDKLKSKKLSISFYRLSHEILPENLNFIYFLALEYYNSSLFEQAEDIIKIALNSDKKYTFSTSINYFYIYCLNILVNIANLKFDIAYQLIETIFFNDDVTNFKFYIFRILKFYIMIYKLINYSTEKEKKEEDSKFLINEMISFFDSSLKQIDDEIENFKKKYMENNSIKNNILDENYFKICCYSIYENEENDQISKMEYNKSNNSRKKFNYEKKNLQKVRLEFIKIFYLLFELLIENQLDFDKKILNFCKNFYLNSFNKYKNDEEEDINSLIIVKKLLFFINFL